MHETKPADISEVLDLPPIKLDVAQATALAETTRSEIDLQISTAKAFPRSLTACQDALRTMATRKRAAAACRYVLPPRGGTAIEGPSVRFAEIVVDAWQNLRVFCRIVEEGQTFVRAQCVAFDLERNNMISKEVRRSICNKAGKRYSHDMINTTSNAAISIALRNAVLSIVPRSLWEDAYEAACAVSDGNGDAFEQRREAMLSWFDSKGISADECCRLVSRQTPTDIELGDMRTLTGLHVALSEGSTTVDEIRAAAKTPKAIPSPTKGVEHERPAIIDQA